MAFLFNLTLLAPHTQQHGATDTVYEAHIFFDNAFTEDGQYNEHVLRLLDLIPFFVPDPNEYVLFVAHLFGEVGARSSVRCCLVSQKAKPTP